MHYFGANKLQMFDFGAQIFCKLYKKPGKSERMLILLLGIQSA